MQQTEHKDTIIAREQLRGADSKAAPGRLRYRYGTRMAIISEDGEGTGYWQGCVYQVLRPSPSSGRQLQTKAGALLLDGVLEVGFARVLELPGSASARAACGTRASACDAPMWLSARQCCCRWCAAQPAGCERIARRHRIRCRWRGSAAGQSCSSLRTELALALHVGGRLRA